VVPPDRRVDPGGRDGCRAPVPWDGTPDAGWPTQAGAEVWLPFPPDARHRNRADLEDDRSSILHLYRRLIALRHDSPALSLGRFDLLDAGQGVLAYRRTAGGQSWAVAINVTGEPVDLSGTDGSALRGLTVAVSAHGGDEDRPFGGRLDGDGAVVLAPRGPEVVVDRPEPADGVPAARGPEA
jgi:alpha-glucosidase